MDMKSMKKAFLLLCCILLTALFLSGCRTRTSGSVQDETQSSEIGSGLSGSKLHSESQKEQAELPTVPDDSVSGGRTKENPEAKRKEFDENAPVEIVAGTERELNAEGEGSGASLDDEEAETAVSRLNDLAEETATQTVPASEAEQMGVSPDADEADSALTYYTVLLQDRMGSLFECQRRNVYWETAEDHVTIYKTSLEHELILNAGAYDVSARLLSENLRVDDGWIARKDPGVIVKAVDSSTLGSGVHSTAAAQTVYRSLTSRNGFGGIEAVKNRRILILSEELLEAPHLQTVAMLLIARAANEDAMSDVDPDEALKLLTEEATGMLPGGTYYYSGKGD